jgi:hypothetical protein
METLPRPRVHLPTVIILTLVGGVLLWLNLQPTKYQDLMNMLPPDDLDPITRALFYRGWPLSPFMLCPVHGMKYHPEDGPTSLALVLLAALGCISEWWIRRGRAKSVAPASPQASTAPQEP